MDGEILIKLDDIEEESDGETAWATAGYKDFMLMWEDGWWVEPDSGGRVYPMGDDAYLVIEIS